VLTLDVVDQILQCLRDIVTEPPDTFLEIVSGQRTDLVPVPHQSDLSGPNLPGLRSVATLEDGISGFKLKPQETLGLPLLARSLLGLRFLLQNSTEFLIVKLDVR
jgi:hypothetical protein